MNKITYLILNNAIENKGKHFSLNSMNTEYSIDELISCGKSLKEEGLIEAKIIPTLKDPTFIVLAITQRGRDYINNHSQNTD